MALPDVLPVAGAGRRGDARALRRFVRAVAAWPLLAVLACGGGNPLVRGAPAEPLQQRNTPEWHAINSPIVREYLTTLSASEIGRAVAGITLSDGRRWFAGHVYQGPREGLPPGVHGRAFEVDGRARVYLWLDDDAEPLALASCETPPDAGIRARRWSGEVLPWKALRPEHGVAYTPCPERMWPPAPDGG